MKSHTPSLLREYTGWVRDRDACERARAPSRDTAAQLRDARVPTEALARFVEPGKRLLIFPRAATMTPEGAVWRLGTLLLGESGELWAAGKVTRAAERGRVGYQSVSREDRKDLAAAALKCGYPEGTVVNFDAHALTLTPESVASLGAEDPIGFDEGEVRVRWRAGAPLSGALTLAQYLSERAGLLIDPPLGAT